MRRFVGIIVSLVLLGSTVQGKEVNSVAPSQQEISRADIQAVAPALDQYTHDRLLGVKISTVATWRSFSQITPALQGITNQPQLLRDGELFEYARIGPAETAPRLRDWLSDHVVTPPDREARQRGARVPSSRSRKSTKVARTGA